MDSNRIEVQEEIAPFKKGVTVQKIDTGKDKAFSAWKDNHLELRKRTQAFVVENASPTLTILQAQKMVEEILNVIGEF